MIVGNPTILAIESGITCAYASVGFRALGYFVIHVGGHCYGIKKSDATMLACSFDQVAMRLAYRGRHTAPFASEPDPAKIAFAFRNGMYSDKPKEYQLGMPLGELCNLFYSNQLIWAPDGDEAFDDSSYVLHFDVNGRVRIIAFRGKGYGYDSNTLRDVWLDESTFYTLLQNWHDAFEMEWMRTEKKP